MRPLHAPAALSFPLALAVAGCAARQGLPVEAFEGAHGEFLRGAVSEAPIQLRWARIGGAEVENEPGEFDVDAWSLDALAPIPLSRDAFLIGGLHAHRRDHDFTGVAGIADDQLWRYGPQVGAGLFLDDDLVVQAVWQPGVYSDHDGSLGARDVRWWYGTGLVVWRQRSDLYWKVGLTLDDAVDTAVIPLAGVVWHFADGWRFESLLPRDAKLVWMPDARWILSGGLLVESDEYHVRGPRGFGQPEHDVHVQERVLFLGVERRLTEHVSVLARGGAILGGDYEWGYGGGLPDYEGDLEAGSYVGVGLGVRF